MIHSIIKSLVAGVLIPLSFSCHTRSSQPELPPEDWPEIPREAKPWTRWWWMGNAVDEKNIGQLLETYQVSTC
ncbi:MAG: hypothetical protein WD426_20155 [Anditalea sp.]